MTKRQRNAVDELTRVAEWLCDGTRYVLESVTPRSDADGGYYEMTFLDALAGEYMLINLPDIHWCWAGSRLWARLRTGWRSWM